MSDDLEVCTIPLESRERVEVYMRDYKRLQIGVYLNDMLIDYFAQYLLHTVINDEAKLTSSEKSSVSRALPVKSFPRRVNLFETKMWYSLVCALLSQPSFNPDPNIN